MTSSPDLIHELRASRPSAPLALRARVRELSSTEVRPQRRRVGFSFPVRRVALVAVPATLAIAFASAGVLGLSRSDTTTRALEPLAGAERADTPVFESFDQAAPLPLPGALLSGAGADQAGKAASNRSQRISATLTVEVKDSGAVSRSAQDALTLTQSLGGYVVSSSVATGEDGSATLTLRVPVDRVQDAIVGLSGLGRIVSQQVTVEDRQESIDAFQRRMRSLRSQIALVNARLESETLDSETRARLETRLKNLRIDLTGARRSIGVLRAEARMSTIQLTVVTPGAFGAVAPPSRIDRTIDEALNVLAWEAVIALGIVIVLAPFALVAFAAWLGRRRYRRHEDERLLTT